MKTCFDFTKGCWVGDARRRVSRHDLVFKAPPFDPVAYGLALGNGDIGVMAWCEESRFMMVMNKCDLWDDVPIDDFTNWKREEEEHSTTLRHGCRLILDFGEPVFDEMYLNDFEARLSPADGLLTLRADSAFGKISVTAFVSYDVEAPGVLCCRVRADLRDSHPIRLMMERYGSRTFSHWYKIHVRDTEVGLDGTTCYVKDGRLMAAHTLPAGTFVCGAAVDGDFAPIVENRHRVGGTLSPNETHTFYAGISSPMPDGAEDAIGRRLDDAVNAGFDCLYRRAADCWEDFWSKSYLETDNDFLDNLWALTLYMDNCCQRGSYPGRFIDGLWATARDFQAWNFIFHWNQQETYWPLHAAGHPELCESYLNYRFSTLDKAKASARKYHNVTNGGAFVSDVCDRRGNNSLHELPNHTPVAEIALDFWRQYRYTCDKDFLKEKALPYMMAAARFMQTCFDKEDDGLYHARSGTGYEGWIFLRDATTEIACTRALLRALLSALDEAGETAPEADLWRDMAGHMAPFTTGRIENIQCNVPDRLQSHGIVADEPTEGACVMAGYSAEHERVLSDREIRGIFPTTAKSPVFPCGDIGLKDRGSDVFDLLVRTEKCFADPVMGWDPSAITAARLGLGEDAAILMERHIEKYLYLSNGFGHYKLTNDPDSGYRDRFYEEKLRVMNKNAEDIAEDLPLFSWKFRHNGLECTGVLSCALNETLLQSYDGVIRLFPAVKEKASARFTLHAVGGFEVSAERIDGETAWAAVRSRGGLLRMENPFDGTCYISGSRSGSCDGRMIEIETEPGELLIFAPTDDFTPETEPLPEKRNEDAKRHPSGRTLGRFCGF